MLSFGGLWDCEGPNLAFAKFEDGVSAATLQHHRTNLTHAMQDLLPPGPIDLLLGVSGETVEQGLSEVQALLVCQRERLVEDGARGIGHGIQSTKRRTPTATGMSSSPSSRSWSNFMGAQGREAPI